MRRKVGGGVVKKMDQLSNVDKKTRQKARKILGKPEYQAGDAHGIHADKQRPVLDLFHIGEFIECGW